MTFHDRNIVGAGGGGGKGKGGGGGNNADDTIRSKAKLRLTYLLGEGEMHTPCIGDRKGVYFGDTPVQNHDNSFNFEGVVLQTRDGTADQAPLLGVVSISTPVSVEVEVIKPTPVIRQITEVNATSVKVIVRIPALVKQKPNGDLEKTTVRYKLWVQESGGLYVELVDNNILKQKCTSPLQIAHELELPEGGAPWNVKFERVTNDSTDVTLQNETWWESYFIQVEGRYTYPHSAIAHLKVDVDHLGQNMPEVLFKNEGVLVQVPVNYDPVARTYSGIWNGNFKYDRNYNPAWVLWDIVTHDRYGLGEFVSSLKFDKWTLFAIGQYCDQLVPSGFKTPGGADIMEPRFSLNCRIADRQEAYKLIQAICSTFRGMTFWSLNQIFATADIPADPVDSFTPANVIDGHFNYSGTALKARHSVCLVTWNDPADLYRTTPELVINNEMLQKHGWRQREVQLLGCTSRGEAHRFGKWTLDIEQHETETVEFLCSWENAHRLPGDIINIADPRKAGYRTGGRIVSIDGINVLLDSAFEPSVGETYWLLLKMADDVIEQRQIMAFFNEEETPRVTVNTAFTGDVVDGAVWVITGTDVVPRQYRVLAVREEKKNLFKITALFHDPTKYARVELGIKLDALPYTRPSKVSAPPLNLVAQELLYMDAGVARSKILISWSPPYGIIPRGYRVVAEMPSTNRNFGQITGTTFEILDAEQGDYTIRVFSVNLAGYASAPAIATVTVTKWTGTTGPTVTDLLNAQNAGTAFGGRNPSIKWTNNLPGTTFNAGTVAVPNMVPVFYRDNIVKVYDAGTNSLLRTVTVQAPLYTYEFEDNVADNVAAGRPASRSVKFEVQIRDTVGRTSAAVTITLTNPVPALVVPVYTPYADSIHVSIPNPTDIDFAGMRVWAKTTSAYNPANASVTREYEGPNSSTLIAGLALATDYFLAVAAYDSFSRTGLNISTITQVTTLAGDSDDTVAPGQVTALNCPSGAVGATMMGLTWTNPSDTDLAHTEIWVNTVNNVATATFGKIAAGSSAVLTGLNTNTQYFVWARAVDLSGNKGIFSAGINRTTRKLVGNEIGDEIILGSHIFGGTITGDKIDVQTIESINIKSRTIVANRMILNGLTFDEINPGAVTDVVEAFIDAAGNTGSGYSQFIDATISVPANSKVVIMASFRAHTVTGNTTSLDIRVRKGVSSTIREWAGFDQTGMSTTRMYSPICVDISPATGNNTYSIQLKDVGAGMAITGMELVLIAAKR